MADIPNIIQSKIISSEWDAFWLDLDANAAQLAPKDVLVLSLPYSAGSAEDVQLQKMLQACQLNDAVYHILQLSEDRFTAWHKLKDQLQPKQVLLLGITPAQLGISVMFRLFGPNRFNDCIWIPGLSLTEMEKQPDSKKQLWVNGLKPVFVDKTV